jgi:hypothetical protein
MFRVLHSTSPDLLASAAPHLTVEAEYGAVVVEGSVFTAAHHQPVGSKFAGDHLVAGGRPAPCNDGGIPTLDPNTGDWTVGVSHLDLDTVGGVLRALPDMADLFASEHAGFWSLAAFVDTSGAHKVALAGASDEDVARLYAWWVYFKTLPRLGFNTLNDATDMVLGCGPVLREILAGDEARIEAGRVFRAAEDALNAASFVEHRASGVLVRKSPTQGDFVNHLYATPSGVVSRAIVAFNPEVGSVTVSLESPVAGVSCREVVQGLWGALAGGHAGIAGSPRGERMTETHLADCVAALEAALARG